LALRKGPQHSRYDKVIDGAHRFCRPLCTLAAAVAASLALAFSAVQGAPLPPEDCQKLAAERTALTAAGIPDQMAKGPTWAKENLPLLKLSDIQRYIVVDEQLAFRCGMGRLQLDIPDDETPVTTEAKKPVSPAKKVVKTPVAKAGAPAVKKPGPPAKAATGVAVPAKKAPAAKAPKTAAKRPPTPPSKAPVLPLTPGSVEAPK
jgi:hypothetical protein